MGLIEVELAVGSPHKDESSEHHGPRGSVLALAFGALGVVYGDIGTSPLYAIKECFHPHFGLEPNVDNVIGICSLVFWMILLVVVVKYIMFVMRADNKGEGGILVLLALLSKGQGKSRLFGVAVTMALIGTALLGADGVITPAISVLSAVEGLSIATDTLQPVVLPVTLAIIIGLFLMQKHGTHRISAIFGPAMLVWFSSLAALAIPAIVAEPGIFAALNPARGVHLLLTHGWAGFLVLGAVILSITGAEALYADMGHFGRRAIKMAWFPVVWPSLILNYFGQGAIIMAEGRAAADNPFYALAKGWLIYPMVAIATMAAIIASQAMISGAYSLAQQAVQLGYSPRLTIVHTHERTKGQIYVPEINALMMAACIALVLIFRNSSALAGAYGIAVIGTMAITSFLMSLVTIRVWGWKKRTALSLCGFFLFVDIVNLSANLPKIVHGGWFPILVCVVVFAVMTTWKRGRLALMRRMQKSFVPVEDFVRELRQNPSHRIEGTAIFMTSNPRVIPPALKHHFIHNQVLHRQVILLSIVTSDVPTMPMRSVLEVKEHGDGFYEVVATFGFMQAPKVDRILRILKVQAGVSTDENKTTYYLGRDILLTDGPERIARWRKMLFAFLMRNSLPATAYYGIPPNRVVELGMQVNL
jgi:KUP system potassium uptake protein